MHKTKIQFRVEGLEFRKTIPGCSNPKPACGRQALNAQPVYERSPRGTGGRTETKTNNNSFRSIKCSMEHKIKWIRGLTR